MNKLSDEEKNIKKAMEEFEIPFDTGAWEKAEILLDKQVKTKWLFKSLIALSVLAVLSISLYLFSSEKSPVSDVKLMVENTHKNLQTNNDKQEIISQNSDVKSEEILNENSISENKNQSENQSFSSKKTNPDLDESNIELIKKETTKVSDLSSKKDKLNAKSNDGFLSKKSNKKSKEFLEDIAVNPKVKNNNSDINNNNNSASQENSFDQNIQKENVNGKVILEENKNSIVAKNEESNDVKNTDLKDKNIYDNKIDKTDKIDAKPKEELTAKSSFNSAQIDSITLQNNTIIPDPVLKYDKCFILGLSVGITAYKKIDKQKTSSLNYTPVLGVFIQKNIQQKFGVKLAINYNQIQLNNISKTYNGTTYSFGKFEKTVTVSPTKLHLLHSNISLLYQFRPQLNFQLGATYIYVFNAKNHFEENKQDFTVANYNENSKFFNGYQAIPAVQFGAEYQNKNGIRYGAYLQQGMKNLVNEKQFGTVQSKTLFNLNLYLSYDLSRF